MVQAARDHGKSFKFSYSYPLFRIQQVRDPKYKIHVAFISYAESQAQSNLDRLRKKVEESPWLRWLYPKGKLTSYTWEKGHLDFSNGCTLDAFGWTSSIRGGHFHLMCVDDPCKDEGASSISSEQQVKNFYRVMVPACRKGGQMVVTGNPVDKHDFLEELEDNRKWLTMRYPAWDENYAALWPEKFNYQELLEIRDGFPQDVFQREYLLQRVAAGDIEFKLEWIKRYKEKQLVGLNLYRVMTIDPSLPGGDAMAAACTGTDESVKTHILDTLRFKGDLEAGMDELCDMVERNEPDLLGMETFAFQKMYQLRFEEKLRERGLNYSIEETGKDTQKTKAMRIKSLQPPIKTGKLLFRDTDSEIIDELLSWNPNSKHNKDDLIDALSWQVPLWMAPAGESPSKEIKPDTFDAAVREVLEEQQNANYINRLFSDFIAHG